MSNLIADVGVCAVAKQQSRHLQVVIRNSVLNSVMQSRSPILNNQKLITTDGHKQKHRDRTVSNVLKRMKI